MGVNIFPGFTSKQYSSLKHLGFSGKCSGLPCRPCLPTEASTVKAAVDYIFALGGSDNFSNPLFVLPTPLPSSHGPLLEVPLDRRVKNWYSMVKKNKK